MENIDEKFDKAEKVVERTSKLILKVISVIVAIVLAIFVGFNQFSGEDDVEYESEVIEYDQEPIIEDTLLYEEN